MAHKKKIKSYYHLTKPGIVYGNLITAVAGFLFASHWSWDYGALVGLIIGVAMVIGGSCALNNIIDKDIDARMERTRSRAIVTGRISTREALIFGSVLLIGGSFILAMTTNTLTMLVAWIGAIIYVVIYGWAKRITVYGTLIGSLSGAMPLLGGYTAVKDHIGLAGIILVFILVCWQMAHFYAIALYRKKDYQAANLPIWSVVKGDWSTQVQVMTFIALYSVFLVSLFVLGYVGYSYLATALIIGLAWFWQSIISIDKLNSTAWGKKVFKSSLIVIVVTSLMLAFGPILP